MTTDQAMHESPCVGPHCMKLQRPIFLNPQRRAMLAVSLLILLNMLPNLVWVCVAHEWPTWLHGLIVPSLLLMLLFAVFGNMLWLACLVLVPFAALAPVEALYVGIYQRPTSAEILATLVASNPRETYEYLGIALWPILFCIIAGLLLALLATLWAWQSGIGWRHRSRAWVTLTAVALLLLASVVAFAIPARLHASEHLTAELKDAIEPGYPFGLIRRVAQYRQEWLQVVADSSRLDAFRFHAHPSSEVRQRQVYVLVIGESSRRDHWQLFGYTRPTNPELTNIKNLVPITNMVTAWPISVMAIPLLLTRKPVIDTNMVWKEASILRAMQEVGFDTWWISNQLPIGKYDSPVATYALEAAHTIYLNHASLESAGSLDEVLLQPLRETLQKSQGNLFIVLHMMGSHLYYDTRYPAAFRKFKPTYDDEGSDALPRVRFGNSYDNTILYTDHVLARVIDILRNDGAITAMLYASDHGEALPTSTCSEFGHGNGTRYEFEVPTFFWYSDDYAAAFPERVSALRANAAKPTMSADLFESMIDMAGIDFPGHDPSRSLFSAQWRYRPRIVNPIWQVDFDKAMFDKKCQTVLPPNLDTRQQ